MVTPVSPLTRGTASFVRFSLAADYYGGVARGRTPSASAASNYDMQGKKKLLGLKDPRCSIFFRPANGNHLMGPIPPSSATYNPMVGAPPQYAHPYGSAGHSTASMHSLPGAAAHMHGVHPQVSAQSNLSMHQNMSMMPSSNGPVLLVSNLNENVSVGQPIDFSLLLHPSIRPSVEEESLQCLCGHDKIERFSLLSFC